ncbi:hypothetical protein BDGGKGIB_04060 [Nodularia sphaerocarpa UHCC 0038]|nr:hypothetical protein BDGGKGIB_04060 [Nodularia sphaerocarpa UHCC 0038]
MIYQANLPNYKVIFLNEMLPQFVNCLVQPD